MKHLLCLLVIGFLTGGCGPQPTAGVATGGSATADDEAGYDRGALASESDDGPVVLARGDGFILAVTADAALELTEFDDDREVGVAGVGDYTRPVTLNEVHPFAVDDGGTPITLVAGPVDDRTTRVEVTASGITVDATMRRAVGLTWLLATFDGHVGVDEAVAYDAEGVEVDRRTLPRHPPPEGPQDRTTIGYQGNHTNCSFGQDPDGPGVCVDPDSGASYCISGAADDPPGATIPCEATPDAQPR